MANILKIKRSSVQGKIPAITDIQLGELAINTYDGKLFLKKDVGGVETVVDVSAGIDASGILSLLKTVDGSGSGLDADLLDGLNSSSTNTASTVVTRNSNGETGLGALTLDGTAIITPTAGKLWLNGTTGQLNFSHDGIVTQQIGEETYVYVKASAEITEGQLIVRTGAVGQSGVITAAPAGISLTASDSIIGIATQSIAIGEFGRITVFGIVRGINTTGTQVGESWQEGDILYYNPAGSGKLTKVKPTSPNIKCVVGTVVTPHQSTGAIQVEIQRGSTLGGTDSNVEISSTSDKDFLVFNATSNRWENKQLNLGSDTIGNYVASVATSSPLSGGAVGSEGSTLTLSLANGYGDTQNPYGSKTAKTFLAAPNAADGVPTFRAILASDIPTLNQNTTGSAAILTTGRTIGMTGDVTWTSASFNGSANVTGTATLANSGVTAGSYGNATTVPAITVDSKGRVTSVTNTSISFPSGSLSFTGDVTGTGTTGSATALTLANSGVAAGTYTKITVDAKGRATTGTTLAASDIPNLDASKITSGVLDPARLPSYVDDVLEYANLAAFPATGETGKIYVALDTNKTYRWSGSVYVYITSGAVDSVAGKTGVVTLTNADVGLANVENKSSATIRGEITSTNVTSALGFTPYNATNPSGYTSNTGTVTSVGITVPIGLSVSGSPITTSGTIAISLATGYSIPTTSSQTNWNTAYTDRNKWDGGSTGLVAATGRTSLGATTLGSNLFTLANPSAITFLRVNADNTISTLNATDFRTAIGAGTSSTTGTVTSVGGTGTVSGLTLSGTVTTSGNLTLGGTLAVTPSNFASQTANTVLAAPEDANGIPTFRNIQLSDMPSAWIKRAVNAATTTALTLNTAQTSIDGVTLSATSRVLVKNQADPAQNGIYTNLTTTTWTRVADADIAGDIAGAFVNVDAGTVNGGKVFDTDFKSTDTIGTTAMNWFQNVDTGMALTSGSTVVDGYIRYAGTTATAGQFYGGTTTPTGSTRLNYGGYFYPTYINLIGSGDTTTAATHYFVETGSDGFVRPKTLANVKTELVTSAAVIAGLGFTPYNSTNPNGYTTNTGTVTSITAGTGLSGGTISTSGTIALANTAVTAGSYTSANITVDAQGRITSASSGSSSPLSPVSGNWFRGYAAVGTDGVMEIGRYIDFHSANAGTSDFDIRLECTGSGALSCSGTFTATSDERLKENWRSVQEDFVTKLAKVKYGVYDRIDIDLTQAGVSAQSLQKVLPEAILEDSNGILSVAYGNAALVAAVELAKEVVELKAQIAELKALIMEK